MKLLITTLTILLVNFGANAFTIEDMYKYCKPLQNNGFDLDGLSKTKNVNATICLTYFRALKDFGARNCILLNQAEKSMEIPTSRVQLFKSLFANADEGVSINSIITSFNTFAENNTDKWNANPAYQHLLYLGKKFPCKQD